MAQLTTAVVLIFFRRLDCLAEVVESLAAARPRRVYAYADGPRAGLPEEAEACHAAADLVQSRLSAVTELRLEQASENLGLRSRVETALDDVFSREETAVILEDDCVPTAEFFSFTTALLPRYAQDSRVGSITGTSFCLPGESPGGSDYYFSKYPHCWGWATWRRAWQAYDRRGSCWPCSLSQSPVSISSWTERKYWEDIFERTYAGKLDSWAYRWTLSCWRRGMLTATPRVNLVRNIGSGEGATHTRDDTGMETLQKIGTLNFPMHNPTTVKLDKKADRRTFWRHHAMGARLPLWARLLRSCRKRMLF